MTTRELKQLLDKSRVLQGRYVLLCDEIERFRAVLFAAKPMSYNNTGGKSEHNDNSTELAYARLADYDIERNKLLHTWLDARDRTLSIISKLDTEAEKEIFKRRYINGEKWEQIADNMNYSRQHINRIHGNALQKMCLNVTLFL